MACECVKDALRGVSLLTALGGLAVALAGLHALIPLGPTAADPSVAWFSLTLAWLGGLLIVLGCASTLGLSAAILLLTGATLTLLPLEVLLVWAYQAHPSQLRWLAARDQTYVLTSILDWVDAHAALAGGLAAVWLLLQAATVLLGTCYACCPGRRRYRHPWARYWAQDDSAREPLLPPIRAEAGGRSGTGSPRAAGFHTPPSRFQSPYTSPARQHPAVTIHPPSAVPGQVANV